MPAKKIPAKTGNKSVLEELPIGYFKAIGKIQRMEASKSYGPMIVVNPIGRRGSRRKPVRVRKLVDVRDIAHVEFYGLDSAPAYQLNIPAEIGDKMRLGKTYEIQCTIVEVKGNDKDA